MRNGRSRMGACFRGRVGVPLSSEIATWSERDTRQGCSKWVEPGCPSAGRRGLAVQQVGGAGLSISRWARPGCL